MGIRVGFRGLVGDWLWTETDRRRICGLTFWLGIDGDTDVAFIDCDLDIYDKELKTNENVFRTMLQKNVHVTTTKYPYRSTGFAIVLFPTQQNS